MFATKGELFDIGCNESIQTSLMSIIIILYGSTYISYTMNSTIKRNTNKKK